MSNLQQIAPPLNLTLHSPVDLNGPLGVSEYHGAM